MGEARTAEQCLEDEVAGAIEDAICNGVSFSEIQAIIESVIVAAEKEARWEQAEKEALRDAAIGGKHWQC